MNDQNIVNNQTVSPLPLRKERGHTGSGAKNQIGPVVNENKIRRVTRYNPSLVAVVKEGGFSFFRYLKSLGLSKEPDLMVLSSKHHYYFVEDDLKSIRILINLKKLNLIKHLDLFLNSLIRIMPQNASFIGYFSDNEPLSLNGIHLTWFPKLINKLNTLLDFKSEHFLNRNEVMKLLGKNGFNVVDMTKMNGLTYFCSRVDFKEGDLDHKNMLARN